MIKLSRPERPKELTDELVARKTEQFKADKTKAVWNETYIKDALMAMSYGKCCYCECCLGEESKYMEVEHFHDKHKHPDEVVQWDNLLPSCKACNVNKGTHDTVNAPIINPAKDNPQEHLWLYNCVRLRSKDELGEETIDTLNLNDLDKHCMPRYKLSAAMAKSIESLKSRAEKLATEVKPSQRCINKLRNEVLELLQIAMPEKEYSAVASTAILGDRFYAELKQVLNTLSIWTDEMTECESKMKGIALLKDSKE